jgi:chaperonin GroES
VATASRVTEAGLGPALERMSSVMGGDATVSGVPVEDPTSDQLSAAVANDTDAGAAKKPNRSRPAKEVEAKLPIKMLNDRILVKLEGPDGERKSSGGILIPATAQVGKRLTWGEVVALGPSVRTMELEDRVLFNPEDRYEVEVGGRDYIILRERDIHAVAAKRLDASHTGLYL